MPTKAGKWSPEEEKALKELREIQNSKNEVNWEEIARRMNIQFETQKTAKQCRERYVNYLKFGENTPLNLKWSLEEIEILKKLYDEHGPTWCLISLHFNNKSQNSIKNKFNNCLRKGAKVLHEFESVKIKSGKRSLSSDILTILLDLSNKIRKMAIDSGLKLSQNCMIVKYRTQILNFCFHYETYSLERIEELIKLIKGISIKLRCFGAFKVKNRKHWKLTKNCLQSICQFDKIINFDDLKVNFQDQEISEEDNQKLNSPTYNTKIEEEDPALLELPNLNHNQILLKRPSLEQQLYDILGYEDQHGHHVHQLMYNY